MKIDGMKRRIMLAAAVAMTLCSNASATETLASAADVVITDDENETLDNRKNRAKDSRKSTLQSGDIVGKYAQNISVNSFSAPWHNDIIPRNDENSFTIVKGQDDYEVRYDLFNVDAGLLTGGAAPAGAMGDDSEYTLEEVDSTADGHGLVSYPDDNGDVWYSVQFKQPVYGSGPNVKYYVWAAGDDNKLVETDSAENSVLTINYTEGADIEKIFVELGGTYDGVGGYYVGSDIKNAIDVMGSMNNVSADFVGNSISITNSDSYNYSAVMSEADGHISKVNSSFIANSIDADLMRDTYGALVKSLGSIDEITSEFIGNSVTSTGRVSGGLVQVPLTGKIGTIHSDFINNSVRTQSADVLGAMINNASGRDYSIGTISGSKFLSNSAHSDSGNLYGNVYNSGVISNGINNTVFTGNTLQSNTGNAMGGAIYNIGVVELTDVSFLHNLASSNSGVAKGGAIYTNADMTINVTEGNSVVFRDNYVQNGSELSNQGIWIDSDLATLNFKIANNGRLKLYDSIDGVSGYRTIFSGNGSVDMFGDINNSNVTVRSLSEGGSLSLNLANNSIHNYKLLSLTSDDSVKWAIDMNLAGKQIDTLTADSSSGTVLIDSINLIGNLPTTTTKLQVLNGGNATLELSQSVIDAYSTELRSAPTTKNDVVNASSTWNDKYYSHTYQDVTTTGLRTASTIAGKTDSIEYFTNTQNVEIAKESLGDTLKLLNQMSGTRSFSSTLAEQVYEVTEDLGTTASGTLNINGLRPTDASVPFALIDGGEHTLFKIDNPNTTINFSNVDIKTDNTSDGALFNIQDESSLVYFNQWISDTHITAPQGATGIINNGTFRLNGYHDRIIYLDTDIKGTGTFNPLNSNITLGNNYSIKQGNILVSGGAALNLSENSTIKADTITNAGTLNMSETSTIEGGSITNTGTMNVWANGILSDITNNKTINLSSGTLKHKLTGTGGYNLTADSEVEIFHDSENPENSGLIESTATNRYLTMGNNSTLTANADDIKAMININGNSSTVNLTGGTVTKGINLNNTGNINILNDLTFADTLGANTIAAHTVINNNVTVDILNANAFDKNGSIANDGILNLYNGAMNDSITGTGDTNILAGIVGFGNNKTYTQNKLYIAEQATLNLAWDGYNKNYYFDTLVNDGVLNTTSGTVGQDYFTVSNLKSGEITGKGTLEVSTTGSGFKVSGVKISQDIKVNSGATLYIGANNINGEVENNGNLFLNGASGQTLKKNVSGTGTLQLANGVGSVINEAIIKNTVFTTNSYLTTNADNLQGDIIGNGSGSGVIFTGGTYNYKVRSNGNGGQGRIYIDTGANVTTNGDVERIYYGEVRSGATWTANGAVAIPITIQSTGTMYANSDLNGATIAAGGNMFINADNLKNTATVNSATASGVTTYGNLNLSDGTIAQTIIGGGNVNIVGDVTMDDVHRVNPRVTVTEDGTLHVNNGGNLTNAYLMNEGKIYWDGDLTKPIQGENGITYLDKSMNMSGTARIDGTLMLENGNLSGFGTNKTWNTGKTLGEGTLGFDVALGTQNATHFNLAEGSAATFDVTDRIKVTGWDGLVAKDASEAGIEVGTSGIAQVLFGDTVNSQLIKDANPSGDGYVEFSQHRYKDYTDDAMPDVYYDDSIGHHHKDGYIKGILEVATTVNPNDSVKWTVTENYWDPEIVSEGDLLHQWNILNPQGDVKYFRFRTADDVYKSQVDTATAFAGGDMNILGVADTAVGSKSVIDFAQHSGFILPNTTKFNISNVSLENGKDFYIMGTGVTSGEISANTEGNGYDISGGIENVDFGGITYTGEGSGNVSYIPVSFTNSNISQIKDATLSGNSFTYTNTDTVYANPTMDAHALSLNNTKIGQSFTDEEGNTEHIGGLYNVKINDNTLDNGNLVNKTYNGLGLNLTNNSYIANIVDSEFKNNSVESNYNTNGIAIYLNKSKIHNIENTVFENNTNSGTYNGVDGAIVADNASTIDIIRDSIFKHNVTSDTNTSSGGGAAILVAANSKLGDIINTQFIENTANWGGSICVSSQNSKVDNIVGSIFQNNEAKQRGGGIYLYNNGNIDLIKDTKFIGNTSAISGGGISSSHGNAKISNISGSLGITATDTENNTSTILQNQNTVADGVTPYTTSVTTSDGTKYDISATTVFKGNTAGTSGGAIYNSGTITSIDGVLFEGNKAATAGGINSEGSISKITNSAFIGHNSSFSSAVRTSNGKVISEISDSLFIDNHVINSTANEVWYGALGSDGGLTKIDNVIFEDNSVEAVAGRSSGGALGQGSQRQGIDYIKNSKFVNNKAIGTKSESRGGAIYTSSRLDLIENTEFRGNGINSAANAVGGAICNIAIPFGSIKDSQFIKNFAEANGYASGGAISNSGSTIASISGSTYTGNYVKSSTSYANGGAIYAGASISEIKDTTFTGNYAESINNYARGGAIFVNASISTIDNVTFDGNYAKDNGGTVWSSGGALHVNNGAIVDRILNSTFKNNYVEGSNNNASEGYGGVWGGAVMAAGGASAGKINQITDSTFENNHATYTGTKSTGAYGGAIRVVTSQDGIINSIFKNNYAEVTQHGRPYGGAIYVSDNLGLTANNNGLTEFTGNYILDKGVRTDEAIYVAGNTKVLTLNANTGGHILFNDIINGNRGYDLVLTGDNTGTISLYNAIQNADVISNTAVNIDTADGNLFDYRYKTLTSSDDAKYTIDIDFSEVKADNFTLDEKSSGTLYIDNLNVLANNDKRTKVQILKTLDDGIKLGINGDNVHLETDIEETLGDTVYDDGDYSEKAGYALSTTDTKFDSITQLVDKDNDALRLITASGNNDVRNFIFNSDNEYTVIEDLTKAATGTLNIQGKESGSVINADGHDMFNLDDNTLNLSNVKIYGSEKIAEMTTKSTLNTDGTVELRGTLSGGTVNVNENSKLFVNNDTLANVTKTNITGTLGLENSVTEENRAGVLEAKEGAGLSLDIDLSAKSADTLATLAGSKGTLTVNYLNYINGNEDVNDFTVQVLNNSSGNNSLKLALAEDLNTYKIKNVSRIEADEVQAVTNFNEGLYNRKRNGELFGKLSLATTATTDDSIKLTATADWETSTEQLDKIGDTLMLVNNSDLSERTFQSNQATDLYKLSDELGEMGQGKFTIAGTVEGDEQSTIDLQDHKGFVVGENTTFNVIDTQIKGKTENIISVKDGSSKVNLSGAYIDGSIVGDEKFNLNISGTNETTITGQVKNADVVVSQGDLSLAGNTFADESTTVKIKGGNISMNDGTLDTYNFHNLSSDSQASYSIDVYMDKDNPNSDKIVAEGSGLITLERFNFSGAMENIDYTDDLTIRILNTSNDNLQLTLSETFMSQINKEHDLGMHEVLDYTDDIKANTLWTDEYWEHYTNYVVKGKLGLSSSVTTNDSLHMYDMHLADGVRMDKLGDTLRLLSQAKLSEDRNFNFEDADNIYNLEEHIGTTSAGKISVNGVADGDKLSTINMQKKSGWGLANETELNINNVEIVNANYRDGSIINVSNENAVVNLNNVKIGETVSKNALSNAGTINMTGGVVNLDTGIVGTGVTNVTGAEVIIADGKNITQSQVNVNDGSLTMSDSGLINGNLSVGTQGSVVVGVENVNNAVKNDGSLIFKNDGTLIQNVSGNGTTHITSNVVNNAKISQNIDIQSGASLDSHTDGLEGKINNDGELVLKGEISDVITGSGITKVNETLNLYAGAGVDGTLDLNDGQISTQDGNIFNYNINKLTGEGTFAIEVNGAASPSADKFIISDVESSGKVNIADLKFLNTDDIYEDFKVQILDTNGNSAVSIALSEELKNKEWKLGKISREEFDTIQAVTKYSDIYNKYNREGNLYGTLVEATTDTPNDSIEIKIDPDRTKWNDNRTVTGTMGDTLALWNTLESDEDKQFVFDRVATYKVSDSVSSIGETKGKNVSIVGFSNGENKATIDFGGKTGFVLTQDTKLDLSDTRLTGADNVIDVKNSNAEIDIHNSIIDGNIQGDDKYNVKISGSDLTTLNGIVKNADTVLDGGKLKFKTSTFADNTDTFNAKSGMILLNNNEYEDYKINSLTSSDSTKYNIDIDFKGKLVDTITVGSGSGTVLLDELNIAAKADDVDKDYKIQILKVGSGDLQLSLTEKAQRDIDDPEYLIGTEVVDTREVVEEVTNWQKDYTQSTQNIYTYGRMSLATTDTQNDSLGIRVSDVRPDEVVTTSQGDVLMVVNKSSDVDVKTFQFDSKDDVYQQTDNLGQTAGKVIVNGVSDENSVSTINMNGYSGFEVPDGSSVELNNVTLTGATAEKGAVINAPENGADILLNNVNIVDNNSNGEHGAAIYSNSDVNITTDNFNATIAGNNTSVDNEAIYLGEDAKLTINTVNNGILNIADNINGQNGYSVNITGDQSGNVNLSGKIDNANVSMDSVTLNLSDNSHFANSDLIINSGTLNLVNNKAQEQSIKTLNVAGDFKMNVDADLANISMDRLPANTTVNNRARINVDKINLLSDTKADSVAIPFAYKSFKGNVSYIGPKELSKSTQVTTAYAPIYKYGISYENRSDMGYFVFSKGAGASPHSSEAYNPSVLVSDVATQSGMQNAMNQAFLYAFEHGEGFMNNPAMDRFAKINSNTYALSTDFNENRQHIDLSHANSSVWVKPYATFESISLSHGPKVDTIDYGTLVGFDSNIKKLRHGWSNVGTVYLGYTGSQIKYSGVDTTMNGGLLGVTETFYKGNLWTAITASAGAGVAEANTMYGKENPVSLMAGVASKTGYNIEFNEGKFIIQPRMMMSYSMVNTFDYTNSAGIRIDSDPMHTIQLNPAVKFIGNVKGWQPYASVGMVWNLMNSTHTRANDVVLPQMHTKPYVEYGVGVQKIWDEKFSAYAQAMVRNGGRTGVALTFGFRWALGKDERDVVNDTKVKMADPKNAPTSRKVLKGLNSRSTRTSDDGMFKNI